MIIPSITGFLKKSKFFRNVAKLSSAKAISLVIALIATPIISRLFDPSDYGVASVFLATMTIVANIFALSYDRAVIFPKKDSTAIRVFVLAIAVTIGITLLAYLCMMVSRLVWPNIATRSGMGSYFWLIPIGAMLLSWRTISVALCLRREDFSAMATADVADVGLNALIRIIWGLTLASSATGLIFGHIFGIVTATVIGGYHCRNWLKKSTIPIGLNDLRNVAVEFKDYVYFRTPSRVSFSAAMRLPVIALGFMFPAEVVGFYAMANRAAGIPLQLASAAVSNVLLGKAMGMRHIDKPLGGIFLKVIAILAVTGAPAFLLVFFFGEEVISWLLGARWAGAGQMVEILSLYLFIQWVGAAVSSTVFEALRLNKPRLWIDVINLILQIATFFYCSLNNFDISRTLWIFVGVSSVYRLLTYLFAAVATVRHDFNLRQTSEVYGAGDGPVR
jgi:O-antigen/teichoic acid export membrane protein